MGIRKSLAISLLMGLLATGTAWAGERPQMFCTEQNPYRWEDITAEFRYLHEVYGIHCIPTWNFWAWEPEDWRLWVREAAPLRKDGFTLWSYQTGGAALDMLTDLYGPDAVGKVVPLAKDEKGGDVRALGGLDKLSPAYEEHYIRPMLDRFAEMGSQGMNLEEYTIDAPTYSPIDIEVFRKDLAEKDEGIEWLCYDRQVKHLNFWGYAEARLGIKKDEFKPETLGSFKSYTEYVPADIESGGGAGDFITYSDLRPTPHGDGEKYWRNIDLFRGLQDYEYFKLCQKWWKYARSKGLIYNTWGPHWRLVHDISHDPYVDYVGMRGIPPEFDLAPGGCIAEGATIPGWDIPDLKIKAAHFYMKRGVRMFNVENDLLGKDNFIATETLHPYRMPIADWRTSLGTTLAFYGMMKPAFTLCEFSVSEAVFDTGSPLCNRNFNLGVLEGIRVLLDFGLQKGRIVRSNWLVMPSRYEYDVFGSASANHFANIGDMRGELYLEGGYIPDIVPSQGTDAPSFAPYHVITMGGEYYSDQAITQISDWLKNDRGRTLFVNWDYLGKHVYGYKGIKGERFTKLGIWKAGALRNYNVTRISWVDDKVLPDVKPQAIRLQAMLPEKQIAKALPASSRVILKGETADGEEVPLAILVNAGQNRIVNVVFPLEGRTEACGFPGYPTEQVLLGRRLMSNLFDYVQQQDGLTITGVRCKYPMDILFRSLALDERGTLTLYAVGSSTVGQEEFDSLRDVVFALDGHQIVSSIEDRSPVIVAVNGSLVCSTAPVQLDGVRLVEDVTPSKIFIVQSAGGKAYDAADEFKVWVEAPMTFRMKIPNSWTPRLESLKAAAVRESGLTLAIQEQYLALEFRKAGRYVLSPERCEYQPWPSPPLPKPMMLDEKASTPTPVTISDEKPFVGVRWYRVPFQLPPAWRGEALLLQLGRHVPRNVYRYYVNGNHIETEDYASWGEAVYQRESFLPAKILNFDGANALVVQINNGENRAPLVGQPVRLFNPKRNESFDLLSVPWFRLERITH